MSNLNETERRNELRKLLVELSKPTDCLENKEKLKNYFSRLERIYLTSNEGNFRHFYSDIFATVSLIDADDSLGKTNVLVDNIEIIQNEYNRYLEGNCDNLEDDNNIRKEIAKLYDHVNLDVARLNYMSKVLSQTDSKIKDIETKNEELNENLGELRNENDRLNKNLEDLRKENGKLAEGLENAKNIEKNYVTILGIFASIVLAFTGGLAFSTSVLENIHLASPCRLAFVVEALAFTFINVIYILTWFIQKINSDGDIKYPCFMKVINTIIVFSAVITAVHCW